MIRSNIKSLVAITLICATLWSSFSVTLSAQENLIRRVDWNRTGTQVAVGTYGEVFIYDTSLTEVAVLDVPFVEDLAWSPQGDYLAIGTSGPTSGFQIQIWDMNSLTLIQTIPGGAGDILRLAWRPDSTRLVTSTGNAKVWDISTGQLLNTLPSNNSQIYTVDWSPNGQYIAGASVDDKTIVIWDSNTGNVYKTLPAPEIVLELIWSPDNTEIAASGAETIYIWEVETEQITTTLQSPGGVIVELDWQQGKIVSVDDNSVDVWDVATGQAIKSISSTELLFTASLSPDSTRLAYGGNGGILEIAPSTDSVCLPSQFISGGDVAGLISAINTANANPDADVIGLAAGTYIFTSINNNRNALPRITTDITICSTVRATLTRSPSAPQFRFFEVRSTGSLTLENLTLTGGSLSVDYDGGAIYNLGTLTVSNVIFSNNQAGVGGAIASEDGQVTVTDSTFTNNASTGDGGAIHSEADLLIETSTFAGNTADDAGAVNNDGGTLTVTDSTFTDNSADDGSAIYNDAGTLTLSGSTFTNNAGDAGGALDNLDGQAQIDSSTFTGNSASDGGAIRNYGGTITLTTSAFSGNTATDDGGALNNSGGILTITDTRLENNTATTRGGAVYSNSSGTMSAHNSCISGNSATAVYAASTGLQDFTGNWWGAANGPGGAGPGSGDTINSKINHASFLTAGCPLP